MHILYYIIGAVVSYFIIVGVVAKFVGIDPRDADEFMPALLIPMLLSCVWPIVLPLTLSGFGGYAIIKHFNKKR